MSEASIASILSTSSDTSRLRLLAGKGDETVNQEVLQQFEALFLQQMLKSMRTASLSDGMFQSEQTEFYRDMYDQQIAADLAQKEVLGISQIINRQLGGDTPHQEPSEKILNNTGEVIKNSSVNDSVNATSSTNIQAENIENFVELVALTVSFTLEFLITSPVLLRIFSEGS